MATPHLREILIRDLPTRSVTLYPSRAYVVREIKDVELKPGPNEIEIYGVTPTADEHSIKVDGTGSATIMDMTVELVPNREIFQEVYPEFFDLDGSDLEPEEESEQEPDSHVKELQKQLKTLNLQLRKAREAKDSATKRMELLNLHGKPWPEKVSRDHLAEVVGVYKDIRAELAEDYWNSETAIEEAQEQIKKSEQRLHNATRESRQQKKREEKAKKKEEEKKRRQEREKILENDRKRREKEKFWPRNVYKVTITLETSNDTPSSSRRSSVSEITLAKDIQPDHASARTVTEKTNKATLALSYITSKASWAPRYDISFNTPNKTGIITYRAEFKNETSETWKDAQVILSTSQASFQGLNDEVPWMNAWYIGLTKQKFGRQQVERSSDEIVMKRNAGLWGQSKAQHLGWQGNANNQQQSLFGSQNQGAGRALQSRGGFGSFGSQNAQAQAGGGLFGSNTQEASRFHFGTQQTQQTGGGVFGRSQEATNRDAVGQGVFGQQNIAHPFTQLAEPQVLPPQTGDGDDSTSYEEQRAAHQRRQGGFGGHEVPGGTSLFGAQAGFGVSAPGATSSAFGAFTASRALPPQPGDSILDAAPAMAMAAQAAGEQPTLDFEESAQEEHGLTSTHEIPGTRTLAPSSLARRHKIATLHIKDLLLTPIAVPKLRPVAFLRARFRNPSSSVTLLRGSAGITLDGTYLGAVMLNRKSPGEVITLPLGVDPAIHISYAKPAVKRSAAGGVLFMSNKESSQVFERNIIVNNTKSEKVDLLLLDQVPVSEEEKLKVEILAPKGLVRDGDVVKTGKLVQSKSKAWGEAKATLKKKGEIFWDLSLAAGAACSLTLEYEIKAPSSEEVVTK